MGSCGGGASVCGCGGSCGGAPSPPAASGHDSDAPVALDPHHTGSCGGRCSGKCNDCLEGKRVTGLNWGRLQANATPGASEHWRQAIIGDTFNRTTGEVLPFPILPVMSQLAPTVQIDGYQPSAMPLRLTGTMPSGTPPWEHVQVHEVLPYYVPPDLRSRQGCALRKSPSQTLPLLVGALPSGATPPGPNTGHEGWTMGLPGSIGRTTLDDEGCESLWWIPGLNTPKDSTDPVQGCGPSDTAPTSAFPALNDGPFGPPPASTGPMTHTGSLSSSAFLSEEAAQPPHPKVLGALGTSQLESPWPYDVGGWHAGCLSNGCQLCIPRGGGCACIQDPGTPHKPPPPPPPPDPPAYHEVCIIETVIYATVGPPTREWPIDREFAEDKGLKGWRTPTLGPNVTKGVKDFNGTLAGFAGYRFELWMYYTGRFALCTWGQDGVGPQEIAVTDDLGKRRKLPPIYRPGDMGNAKGYDPPKPNNYHDEKYYMGGKVTVYDAPGTICVHGWTDWVETWRVRAWARGTDGSYKEDTIPIRVNIPKCP